MVYFRKRCGGFTAERLTCCFFGIFVGHLATSMIKEGGEEGRRGRKEGGEKLRKRC
jgi:hypothetical protein